MPPGNIFKKILFCTDFSANADRAFQYALNLAEGNPGSELIICHIVPEPDAQFWKSYIYELDGVDTKAKADIDAKIEKAILSNLPQGIRHSIKIEVGRVNQKILEIAEELQVDVVVLGRQGASRLKTLFYGNTAEDIARKSPCPVLIVPPEPQEQR